MGKLLIALLIFVGILQSSLANMKRCCTGIHNCSSHRIAEINEQKIVWTSISAPELTESFIKVGEFIRWDGRVMLKYSSEDRPDTDFLTVDKSLLEEESKGPIEDHYINWDNQSKIFYYWCRDL